LKITQFELQWRQDNQADWILTQNFQTSNLDKTHSGLTNKATYLYRIRAKNIFCWGEWSKPDLKVQTGSRPGVVLTPKTAIVAKKVPATGSRRLAVDTFVTKYEVSICWKMSNDAEEAEVASYEVAIQTSNYRIFKENKALCDGGNEIVIKEKCCRLPMSTFWDGEYRQDQGQLITAKVRARNAKGWGQFSRKNTSSSSARVEKIPKPMQNPQASRDDKQSAISV